MLARMTSSRNDERQSVPAGERPPESATNRGSTSGTLTRANFVRFAVSHDDREVLAEIRNERERMPRVERQRRQHGADLAREVARRGTRGSAASTHRAQGT